MKIWRYLFAASAVLFVIGVVVQIFLAGLGLPRLGGGGRRRHRGEERGRGPSRATGRAVRASTHLTVTLDETYSPDVFRRKGEETVKSRCAWAITPPAVTSCSS